MTPSTRRIKVLWVTKGLGPGGAERLLLSFGRLGDHNRFEFHAAYLLPWKDHLVSELETAGVRVHCLDSSHVADPRWMLRLRQLVTAEGFDIVHNHSPLVAALTRTVLRSLPERERPTLIGTEHNLWSSHNDWTRRLNQTTAALEHKTIAVSDDVRDSMPIRLGARTEVVLHGVEVEAIAARVCERVSARERLAIEPQQLLIVTVANLRANKDYPTMLRTARHLVDQGADVRFVSVGQGPLEEELPHLRDELGLGDRFTFLGYEADPIGVLAAADIFCLSSRYEGLPISLLEAISLGLPVAATDVGGIPQVITDGQEGFLVPPSEPAKLADAISRLQDPAVRGRMATAARKRSQDFDMRNAVDRQQEIYEQLA